MSGAGRGRSPAAPLACPSANPDWEDAQLLGVVLGTADAPETWFTGVRPVEPEMLAAAAPAHPAEVFRFTARCREGACAQFANGQCRVGAAVAAHLEPLAAHALPRCGIRPTGAKRGRQRLPPLPDRGDRGYARDGAYAEALPPLSRGFRAPSAAMAAPLDDPAALGLVQPAKRMVRPP